MVDRTDGVERLFERGSEPKKIDEHVGMIDLHAGAKNDDAKTVVMSWPGSAILSFALFGALAFLGIELTRAAENVAVFWPANVAIVVLGLASGKHLRIPILLGAFIANVLVQFAMGDHWMICLGLPLANCIEIVLILLAFNRLGIGFQSITNPIRALHVICILVLSAIPAALIGATTLTMVYGTPFATVSATWWAGDLSSCMIVLLPLLSPWPSSGALRELLQSSKKHIFEIGAGVGLTLTGYVLFTLIGLAPTSAIVLPLLWLALRSGVFLTALFCTLFVLVEAFLIVFGTVPMLSSGLDIRDAIFQLQITSIVTALPVYLVAVAIHAQHVANAKLLEKENEANLKSKVLAGTLAGLNYGISCFDSKQRLTIWNKRYAELFDMKDHELKAGQEFIELLEYQKKAGNFEGDPKDLIDKITQRIAEGQEFRTETGLLDDRIIYTIHTPAPAGGWIATHEDVTERHKEVDIIRNQALHDPLTGLPNRRYFDEKLAQLKKDCTRSEEEGIAILQVDLDNFKEVNDTLGHDAGDAILIHASKVLQSALRDTDFVARLGGDEFVAICPVAGSTEFLPRVAKRLVSQMKQPIEYNGQTCQIGASVGIACGMGLKIDFLGVMRLADEALYKAKSQGRSCFVASGIPDLRIAS